MLKKIEIRSPFNYKWKKEFNLISQVVSNSFLNNLDVFFSSFKEWNIEFAPNKDIETIKINKETESIFIREWFDFDRFVPDQEDVENRKLILLSLYTISRELNTRFNWNKEEKLKDAYEKTLKENFAWQSSLSKSITSENGIYQILFMYEYNDKKKLIDIFVDISGQAESFYWKVNLLSIKPLKYYLDQIVIDVFWPTRIHFLIFLTSDKSFNYLLEIPQKIIRAFEILPSWCFLPSEIPFDTLKQNDKSKKN